MKRKNVVRAVASARSVGDSKSGNPQGDFCVLCNAVIDFSTIKPETIRETPDGDPYRVYKCDVLFFFGGPEIMAQAIWTEDVSLLYS